jgi:hypothetical protein
MIHMREPRGDLSCHPAWTTRDSYYIFCGGFIKDEGYFAARGTLKTVQGNGRFTWGRDA